MLARPDKEALLEALARFVENDVKPALQDPALAYRAIIASGLARSLALETRSEEGRETRELARLGEILGAPAPATAAERKAAIAALNRTLCERIRARGFDARTLARVRTHLLETLADELAVTNPRFDARAVIP
jgi:hypothetical protein